MTKNHTESTVAEEGKRLCQHATVYDQAANVHVVWWRLKIAYLISKSAPGFAEGKANAECDDETGRLSRGSHG